jgi:predicted DCC family thiol-disulfide oxidoreductase YuxK
MEHPIVFFDGDCKFCNRSVYWIVCHDRDATFRFASLQSVVAQKRLQHRPHVMQMNSLVLLQNGMVYTHSDALLRIAVKLDAPWNLLSLLRIIPRMIRDFAYAQFAKRRHMIITNSQCPLWTAEQKERMMD